MSDWNAELYDNFGAQRQRAAAHLVAAIPAMEAVQITDLGCGSGLSTELLVKRWPQASVTGIDASPTMLDSAAKRVPAARFLEGDIAAFTAAEPQNLIFANASLHWLADHRGLLPRLVSQLTGGGVLALQMPHNLSEPSHLLMDDIAARAPYAEHLDTSAGEREPLLAVEDYYDCLSGSCSNLDIWLTSYYHVLRDARAIVDWFTSTGLKPYLDKLPAELRSNFRADYAEAIADAYPVQGDGRVLLKLPRLFIVATRS